MQILALVRCLRLAGFAHCVHSPVIVHFFLPRQPYIYGLRFNQYRRKSYKLAGCPRNELNQLSYRSVIRVSRHLRWCLSGVIPICSSEHHLSTFAIDRLCRVITVCRSVFCQDGSKFLVYIHVFSSNAMAVVPSSPPRWGRKHFFRTKP